MPVNSLGDLQDEVDLSSSSPSTVTAGADTITLFSRIVRNWYIQNNTSADIYVNYEQEATPGSTRVFANGGVFSNNSPLLSMHVYSTLDASINGTTNDGIVLKGWR